MLIVYGFNVSPQTQCTENVHTRSNRTRSRTQYTRICIYVHVHNHFTHIKQAHTGARAPADRAVRTVRSVSRFMVVVRRRIARRRHPSTFGVVVVSLQMRKKLGQRKFVIMWHFSGVLENKTRTRARVCVSDVKKRHPLCLCLSL